MLAILLVRLVKIDELKVLFLFRVFFYGTVFLLASSYRTIPIACHFACLSLLWGFVGL